MGTQWRFLPLIPTEQVRARQVARIEKACEQSGSSRVKSASTRSQGEPGYQGLRHFYDSPTELNMGSLATSIGSSFPHVM